jgi:hypothetical protein
MYCSKIVVFRSLALSLIFLLLAVSAAFAEGQKHRVVSDAGNAYELTFAEESLEVMKPLRATLGIADATGKPVLDAKISCSLTMPAMAMPKNVPPMKPSEEAGVYEGVFLLTMGGLWHVEISAIDGSGQKDAAVIQIAGVASDGASGNSVDAQLESLFQDKKKE